MMFYADWICFQWDTVFSWTCLECHVGGGVTGLCHFDTHLGRNFVSGLSTLKPIKVKNA